MPWVTFFGVDGHVTCGNDQGRLASKTGEQDCATQWSKPVLGRMAQPLRSTLWMDGWMDGWMEGWMDGWMMDGRMDGRTEGWMEGRTDGWMEGRTDGWMDGRMDGWMDG